MSWSSAFIGSLSKGQSLSFLFRLEFVHLKFGPSRNFVIDVTNSDLQIESDSVRINGTRVQAQSFNVTFGEFSLNLVGDYRVIREKIARGAVAFLYVGFRGYTTPQYQRLIWGQLKNIRKLNYNTFELQFDDALSLINNRLDLRYDTGLNIHKSGLYYTLGQTTTVSSDFTTATDTTLAVANVDIFEKDSGTNGLIKITEAHASEPFFAQWTSKSTTSAPAGTLTLATTGPFAANYPTTTAAAPSLSTIHAGTTVTNCALIKEFPPHILGKVLQTNTGGILDTLPTSWGVSGGTGDLPSDLYDYADADAQKVYIKAASTTYKWAVPILEPVTEFARTLTTKASALGQFPVLRQGKISWRGVNDPSATSSPNLDKKVATNITDNDIISVQSHSFFDPESPAVYSGFKIIYDQNGTTTTISRNDDLLSLPAFGALADIGDGQTYDPSNTRLNMAVGDGTRMESYYRYTCEKIVLNTSMRLAAFVAGDNVSLTSSVIYGKHDITTFNGRVGMISGVDIDFGSRSCFVTILFLPPLYARNTR